MDGFRRRSYDTLGPEANEIGRVLATRSFSTIVRSIVPKVEPR
jgi:hypothetical protein